MHPLLRLLPSALLAASLLAACGKRETAVETGIRTGTLIVGNWAEPSTVDPGLAVILDELNLTAALFEGLTVVDDATTEIRPGIAARWEVSPDGLQWTFHLRPSARWSNGDPVTAGDFVYAFRRILSPQLASSYSYMLWPIKNARALNTGALADPASLGATAIDAATLRLTLERPTPHLPALAAHSTWLPVHRGCVEASGASFDRTSPWAKPGRLVGNGPFVLESWQPNNRIVLARNPHYWDAPRVGLSRLVFLPVESPEIEESLFRAGQMHATTQLPTTRLKWYRENRPELLHTEPLLSSWYLNLNTTRPPLHDVRVRRALSLAVDREALCRIALSGARAPAFALTPPHCGGYTARARAATDAVAARRLLAEAGFPEGRGMPELELQIRPSRDMGKVAEFLQECWRRELGIRVSIAQLENKIALDNQHRLAYSIAIAGWIADYPDPLNFLETNMTGNGNNWTGWSHPAYDRLLDTANATADTAARFELLQQAEAILMQELPAIPLHYDTQTYLLHPGVRGWTPAPLQIRHYQYIRLEQ